MKQLFLYLFMRSVETFEKQFIKMQLKIKMPYTNKYLINENNLHLGTIVV